MIESLFIYDASLLPGKLKALDSGYDAFVSTLWVHHRHQNTAAVIAKDIFLEAASDVDGRQHPELNRARTRWHLAYTLLKNPTLIHERVRPEAAARNLAAIEAKEAAYRNLMAKYHLPVT